MKLLVFERIEDKNNEHGIDPDGEWDWFVKLETEKERELYERTNVITEDCKAAAQAYDDWNWQLKKNLGVEDDDVYYYFMENQAVPKIGEQFEISGLVFRREK